MSHFRLQTIVSKNKVENQRIFFFGPKGYNKLEEIHHWMTNIYTVPLKIENRWLKITVKQYFLYNFMVTSV